MITIEPVRTRRDIHLFHTFPLELYRGNPYFVPSLIFDEKQNFNPKKNPAYDHVETVCFLAYRDGEVVGRISGLINHRLNEQKDELVVRFHRFDVVDDIEVTRALMASVEQWGASRGMDRIIGPIGFSDVDREGMLVEGFDQPGMFITIYNYPYYPQHMEKLGFQKDADWVEYLITVPKQQNERIQRICDLAVKRYGYRLLTFTKKKRAFPYIRRAFVMYNDAFAHLYGFYPLSEAQVELVIRQFVNLVNLEYVFIVENKEGEVIGLGIMVPSLSDALRKSQGRLLPAGWLRILKALKQHTVLDLYLIAVKPEYQGRGVNAVILNEGIKRAVANGVLYAETGPELEDNQNVQSQWKNFEHRQHKRRRCYSKRIAPNTRSEGQ